ncbi:hypothetical protein [Deinococcus arcticus]|uniref:PEGA domain-containing protein n=1 Tax=Deinococcus arcticus TaxID=2136176 RepID=A0A2T3W8I2_9DEIO|nr:hypothetical protein [Deinococcus arcticus]PTA68127.1 hypothetical protein C8263_08605 [Deinococcus arcticus]
MKSIGPYVAARDLPGRPSSPVQTLRATDRLTGMPVLLHLLPAAAPLPELPAHPHLLAPVDSGAEGAQHYVVTELPLQARPASDPDLTARGALAALSALHAQGLVHGGLSPSQLWSVDGQVLLAGAGLPWGGQGRPDDDLYALAVILHELGGLPRALEPLATQPGRLSAAQALARLGAPPAATSPEAPVPPADAKQTSAAQTPIAQTPAVQAAPAPEAAEPAAAARHDGTPIVLGAPPGAGPVEPTEHPTGGDGATAPSTVVATRPTTGAPATPSPGAARSQTPQERRRQENEARRAQAALDAQAAAARKAEARRAQAAAAGPAAPAPVQIGFDDLPAWTPDAPPAPGPRVGEAPGAREVERLPASLRRQTPPPAPDPEPAPTRLPRRTAGEPIRIGWDEDDSWRVVREAPAPAPRPTMPEWARPEWFGPRRAVTVLAALLLVGGTWWALSQRQAAPATPASATQRCCEVRLTVRGTPGVSARLSVVDAPEGAGLTRGQDLGRAPGLLRLPLAGTYRLRVVADGWSPATLTVTVPRTQPVTIDLSD